MKEIVEEANEDYQEMPAIMAGSLALKWLNEIDQLGAKSKNIKGDISGSMKKKIAGTTGIIKLLYKIETKENSKLLKMRNLELQAEMKTLEKDRAARVKEIGLHKIVGEIQETKILKKRIVTLENKDRDKVIHDKDAIPANKALYILEREIPTLNAELMIRQPATSQILV